MPFWLQLSLAAGLGLLIILLVVDLIRHRRRVSALDQLARIVEESPNLILVTGPDGTIEYVNPGFTQMSGFTAAEVIGRTPSILKSGITPKEVFQDLWQTITQGKIWRGEMCNRHKNGTLFWNFASVTPVLDGQGNIARYLSVQIDITEHKRLEEALRKSEAHLLAIGNAVPDLLCLLDAEGRYVDVLSSRENLLSAAAGGLEGRRLTEVHPPATAEHLLNVVQRTLQTRQTQLVEYELQVKGEQRWFEARTAPVETDSATPAVVVVARDITQRRAAEEQLRQAQKMQALGQLTGGVAHDFNNLLAIILGNLELLTEELTDRSDLQNLAYRALDAADRGAALTQKLLAFSRQQPLQARPTDLNRLILGMLDLLRRTLGETIKIKTVLAENLWQTRLDSTQFESALLNLAVNARDAMPEGGLLILSTANNHHPGTSYADTQQDIRPGDYVMLAVTDTGIGMTREVRERAFEPFFTTKSIGKGSGLGLSMVYGLVRQSGGHVTIDSQVGQGTTVRLYLPRTQTRTETKAEYPKEQPLHRGKSETILVVEDDPGVRRLAVNMLTSLGYGTLQAGDAEAALKLLDEWPDVVLLFTDVVLPGGMNGAELAQLARQSRPHLKVLFTSGYTEHALIRDGQLEEGVELIPKPYRKSDLSNKLHTMLSP